MSFNQKISIVFVELILPDNSVKRSHYHLLHVQNSYDFVKFEIFSIIGMKCLCTCILFFVFRFLDVINRTSIRYGFLHNGGSGLNSITILTLSCHRLSGA